MMQSKSIHIIGAGLYGCLTAFHIAKKYPNFDINLIEGADRFMTPFNSIEISGVLLNNGFHGVELPRATNLLEFFSSELKAPFKTKPNRRWMSINGYLVNFEAPLSEWPDELKRFFKAEPPFYGNTLEEFWSVISTEYQELIDKTALRYTKNSGEMRHFFIPWFFPADYILNSDDEGDIFRNQVRNGSINPEYAHPDKHVFADLQATMAQYLKKLGIKVHLSTQVKFTNKGIEYINNDEHCNLQAKDADKVFFCASSAIMLKDVNPEMYVRLVKNKRLMVNALLDYDEILEDPAYFSEIICIDEQAPHIARISSPKSFGAQHAEKKLLQVEVFIEVEEDLEKVKASLEEHIKRILKLRKENNLKQLGAKITRAVFYPTQHELDDASNTLEQWRQVHCPHLVLRNNFVPVNMAKTWILAKENATFFENNDNAC
jgi:hypothetical protein